MRNAFAAALVITVGAVAELSAEPVLIQPGSYYAVSNLLAPDGTFETTGVFILPSLPPGFGVPIFGRELSNNARTGCDPCAPGDPWNLGASFELVGPSYLPGGPVFSIWGRGTLNFTTPDITVPFEVPSPQTGLYAYAPFQMTGYIELFRHPGSVPLFAGDPYAHRNRPRRCRRSCAQTDATVGSPRRMTRVT
jgi:hypothetical protein